jgi:hypothetical protein
MTPNRLARVVLSLVIVAPLAACCGNDKCIKPPPCPPCGCGPQKVAVAAPAPAPAPAALVAAIPGTLGA